MYPQPPCTHSHSLAYHDNFDVALLFTLALILLHQPAVEGLRLVGHQNRTLPTKHHALHQGRLYVLRSSNQKGARAECVCVCVLKVGNCSC